MLNESIKSKLNTLAQEAVEQGYDEVQISSRILEICPQFETLPNGKTMDQSQRYLEAEMYFETIFHG